MEKIFEEIRIERENQDKRFGKQNHPILDPILINKPSERMCDEYEIPTEDRAREILNIRCTRGDLTYMHILIEEISEIACCGSNTKELRKEIIQSAAVLVAMVEALDRNGR
jgi:predicted small integral membrane protein